MFDTASKRFFYYDSGIEDAVSTDDDPTTGIWHYITLSVNAQGQGYLKKNDKVISRFTTTSRPAIGGGLSMCATVAGAKTSQFFSGVMDEIAIHSTYTTPDEAKPSQGRVTESVTLHAYFPFSETGFTGLPGTQTRVAAGTAVGAIGEVQGAYWILSTAPWMPAKIVDSTPSKAPRAGTSETFVEILGVNFAWSKYFDVSIDGESQKSVYVKGYSNLAVAPFVSTCGVKKVGVHNYNPTMDLDPTVDVEFKASVEETRIDLIMYLSFSPADDVAAGTRVPDRNGRIDSAVEAPFSFASVVDLSAAAGTTSPTIVAWVYIDHEQDGVYRPDTATGAWKLISFVPASGQVTVGVEVIAADHSAYQYYADLMTTMMTDSNATFTGIVDDVWLYGRPLAPCEVFSLYFTPEWAVDTSAWRTLPATPPSRAMPTINANWESRRSSVLGSS